MGDWQPIETAPKDGVEFDGWGYCIPDSGWAPTEPKYSRLTECFWGKRSSHYVKPEEGWCSTGHDGWAWAVVLTHWMPPPAAPQASKPAISPGLESAIQDELDHPPASIMEEGK